MKITVYTADCASCGKNKVQLGRLSKATWNDPYTELVVVNIRNSTMGRNAYNEARATLTNKTGDLDAIVASDEGHAIWLRDVQEGTIAGWTA